MTAIKSKHIGVLSVVAAALMLAVCVSRIAVPSVATMTIIISSRGRPSIPPFLFILNSLFLSHILCVILTT